MLRPVETFPDLSAESIFMSDALSPILLRGQTDHEPIKPLGIQSHRDREGLFGNKGSVQVRC